LWQNDEVSPHWRTYLKTNVLKQNFVVQDADFGFCASLLFMLNKEASNEMVQN
jgi:hypothetical protein